MNKLTVYTSPTCVKCIMVKSFLDSEGIPYEAKDITNPVYRKEVMTMGVMSVPVTVLGSQYVVGFEKDQIKALSATL